MKHILKLAPVLLIAVLAGCATVPAGPSVSVLPAPNKTFNQFTREDETCRDWAEKQLDKPVQETRQEGLANGAVGGTAIGAGLGAALGAASGNAGVGAAFGAVTGLLFGSAIGSDASEAAARAAQNRYDNAYVQCMYSYGNQIPGARRAASSAPRVAVAPPPPPPPAAGPYPDDPAAVPDDYYAPPPEVYLEDAPRFVYSPNLGMYVAVGVPYDLVYTGNEYYYFYGGRWYRSPYYNGPWVYAPRRSYPRAFATYRISHIRRYRDAEYRRYMHDREHYDGRMYRPEYRAERHREERR